MICSGVFALVTHLYHGFVVNTIFSDDSCLMVCGGGVILVTHLYQGVWWNVHSSDSSVA